MIYIELCFLEANAAYFLHTPPRSTGVHIHLGKYIHMNKMCLHIRPLRNRSPIGVFYPRGDYFSYSQHFSVACRFLCRIKVSWAGPVHLLMFLSISLVQLTFRCPCWWDFLSTASGVISRQISLQIPWSSGSFNLFIPLLQCSLNIKYGNVL